MRRRQIYAAAGFNANGGIDGDTKINFHSAVAVNTPIKTTGTNCKKCGKEFRRGLFMHEKYCKGK